MHVPRTHIIYSRIFHYSMYGLWTHCIIIYNDSICVCVCEWGERWEGGNLLAAHIFSVVVVYCCKRVYIYIIPYTYTRYKSNKFSLYYYFYYYYSPRRYLQFTPFSHRSSCQMPLDTIDRFYSVAISHIRRTT